MKPPTYQLEVIQEDRTSWETELLGAIEAEIRSVGVENALLLNLGAAPNPDTPSVSVFLGSSAAAASLRCQEAVRRALTRGWTIIPVVADLARFQSEAPPELWPINGLEWPGSPAIGTLARFVLEELGIEDKQRKIFISHKRDDGVLAAEQLHDYLSKRGFEVFIDRFDIRAGTDVQRRIADVLESFAFLLLLETPKAHLSPWVVFEVDYALAHFMGIHIVRWPGSVVELPGTHDLRRQTMSAAEMQSVGGYDSFVPDALTAIHLEVEAAHASSLVRRRRYLLNSIRESAESAGLTCLPLPRWQLLLQQATGNQLARVTPRLPAVDDMWLVDTARAGMTPIPNGGVVVHAARVLPRELKDLLRWSAGDRPITLLPENAVGGYW